ncbi:hypothetical protein, partial [Cognatiluteimonas telluris]|uniref:hypothetical protein n=1 Tax=Cognatiluteimonas telluris TaxID=1104775 RepID=UPI001A9C4C8C
MTLPSPLRTGLLACLLLAAGAVALPTAQAKAPSPERAMAPAMPPELPLRAQPGADAAATPNAARVAAEVRGETGRA